MTQAHGLGSLEFPGEVAHGSAPEFGAFPEAPFEHSPELLVLSAAGHSRLSGWPALSELGGEFASERYGHGSLSLRGTGAPGEVRVVADISGNTGPALHLDALVRESWLARAAGGCEPEQAAARVVGGLMELAVLPRQSTVKVRLEAD